MVKGINKRVIVVKAPDPRLFEQAIFIMREDAFAEGVSAEQVLEEAQKAAKSYVRGNTRVGRWIRFLPAPAWAAAGALAATAAWSLALFFSDGADLHRGNTRGRRPTQKGSAAPLHAMKTADFCKKAGGRRNFLRPPADTFNPFGDTYFMPFS